jgi:hypothetical protein
MNKLAPDPVAIAIFPILCYFILMETFVCPLARINWETAISIYVTGRFGCQSHEQALRVLGA